MRNAVLYLRLSLALRSSIRSKSPEILHLLSGPGLEGVVEPELEKRDDKESEDVLDEVPMTSVARPGEAVSTLS